MNVVLRLVLILVLTSGAVIAPDVSWSSMPDTSMAQMNTAESTDGRCDACDPIGYADGIACKGECTVPCGSNGPAAIIAKAPSTRLAMPFGAFVPVAEPLLPHSASLTLDPFPPKLPV